MYSRLVENLIIHSIPNTISTMSFLKGIEDPKRRLLAPTIWSLELTGLVLSKNRFRACQQLFVHLNVLYFVITQFTEAYFIRDNLGLVLTNLKIAMLSFAAIIKICSFIFFQSKWHQIINYITNADQYERTNQDEIKEIIINAYTKKCRKVTYFYWFLMFNTHLAHVVAIICQPLFLFVTSDTYRQNFRNGTVPFPHIFSSWTPFDKELSPGCWLLFVWHYLLCVNGALVVGAYDATIVVFIVFFGGKFDLLRERCKDLFGKNGKGISNEAFEANLKHCHQTHVELLKHSRMLNSLMSPVMFFYIILCTLMLCASLYQITSEADFFQKLLLAEYLIFGVAQLFLVCFPSHDCFIKSQQVAMGPYECEWWNSRATVHQKKKLFLLCGQLRQENKFTAGPFTDLNLQTFVTIIKGAYSYYTLLRD